MKRSAYELCLANGIKLRSYGHGKHYTTCPECSPHRKPHNRKKPCLGVKVDDLGIKWACHHCGAHGYAFYDSEGKDAQAFRYNGLRGSQARYRCGGEDGRVHGERRVQVRLSEQRRVVLSQSPDSRQALVDRAERRRASLVADRRPPRAAFLSETGGPPRHYGGRI